MCVTSSCVRPALLAVTGLLLLGGSRPAAQAQVTLYNDSASFTAAAPSLTSIDFQTGITNGSTVQGYDTSAGLTLNGVNFVGPVSNGDYRLGVVNPAFYPAYSGFNGNPTVLTDGSNDLSNVPRALTITLPGGTTAVGMNLFTVQLGDFSANTFGDVTFALSTGDTFTVHTFEKPTLAFAGFTSVVPITSLTVTTASNVLFPELSSFVFGPPTPLAVPEPSALALLAGLCLSGSGFLARRKRKSRAV